LQARIAFAVSTVSGNSSGVKSFRGLISNYNMVLVVCQVLISY
jgi:hypothetical protein